MIKSVFIISLIFLYVEFQILFTDSWEAVIEGNLPQSQILARYEKLDFIRIIFHLCVHTAVGFARVFFDAEKKFIKDDKAAFFKTMIGQSKAINEVVSGWDTTNFFKKEKEEAEKKAKQGKSGWGKWICYIILAYFIGSSAVWFIQGFIAASQGTG